jgi:TonB family protein
VSARTKARRQSTLVFVLVSVALHAVLALLVGDSVGRLQEKLDAAPAEPAATAPEVAFAQACTLDVGAMTAARLAYCASPLADPDCSSQALSALESELILCEMQTVDMPAVSKLDTASVQLLDANALANFKPKPLIEALRPQDPKEVAKKEEKRIEELVEKEKRQQERPSASAQIVEITQPELEMRPDKARFVSEYDSKVAKETVARASTDKMVARPGGKTEPEKVDDSPKIFRPQENKPESGKLGTKAGKVGRSGDPGLLAMRGPRAQSSRLNRLSQGFLAGATLPGRDGIESSGQKRTPDIKPQTSGQGGEGGEGGDGGARVPNLRPSDKMLQKMVGGGSVDKLDGVESGNETALNSRRWKYASFFNRMKRRVAQNWHPGQAYMRRDPTGRVYGSKDRVTVLKVSLTPTGRLANVVVIEGSGVSFLDDEAVRAFRAAQPFPNPPSGLVDKGSQQITFSFGFHFQIDGPNDAWWKFKRY